MHRPGQTLALWHRAKCAVEPLVRLLLTRRPPLRPRQRPAAPRPRHHPRAVGLRAAPHRRRRLPRNGIPRTPLRTWTRPARPSSLMARSSSLLPLPSGACWIHLAPRPQCGRTRALSLRSTRTRLSRPGRRLRTHLPLYRRSPSRTTSSLNVARHHSWRRSSRTLSLVPPCPTFRRLTLPTRRSMDPRALLRLTTGKALCQRTHPCGTCTLPSVLPTPLRQPRPIRQRLPPRAALLPRFRLATRPSS